jgi:prevent-host-death family protein
MKTVGIAELKARLSEHLRAVRGGRPLTILDRDTPVARLVPYEASEPLRVRRATRKASEIGLPPPPAGQTDSMALLLEDRAKR